MEYINLVCVLILFAGIVTGRLLVIETLWRKLREKAEKNDEEKEIEKKAGINMIVLLVLTVILLASFFLVYFLEVQPDIQKFNELIKGG